MADIVRVVERALDTREANRRDGTAQRSEGAAQVY